MEDEQMTDDDELVTIVVAVSPQRHAFLREVAERSGASLRTVAGVFLEKGISIDASDAPAPFAYTRTEEELLHQLAVARAYIEDDHRALAALLSDYPNTLGLLTVLDAYVRDAELRLAPPDLREGRAELLRIIEHVQRQAVQRALRTGHNGATGQEDAP